MHFIIYFNVYKLATIKTSSLFCFCFFSADEPPYIAAASVDDIWKQDLDSTESVEQIMSYNGDVKGKKPKRSYIEHYSGSKR